MLAWGAGGEEQGYPQDRVLGTLATMYLLAGGHALCLVHIRPDNIRQNIKSLRWPYETGKHSLHISGLNLGWRKKEGGGRES